MTDYPFDTAVPTHINTWMDGGGGQAMRNVSGLTLPASVSWGTANLAIFVPFLLPWPYLVNRAFWANGSSATGNTDIGIYTAGGTRLWSIGPTAQAGASAIQYVTVAGGLLLDPGRYYLAVSNDGTTNRISGASATSIQRLAGILQQAAAATLPASATFAAATSSAAYPLAGITTTASGF